MKTLHFSKKLNNFEFLPKITTKYRQKNTLGSLTPKVFDFCSDAFITGKKLKLSKFLTITLTLAVVFQFAFFATPVLAAEAVENSKKATSTEEIVFENGAILSELETELVQKELIVVKEEVPEVITQESLIINQKSVEIERKPVNINTLSTLGIENPDFIDYGVRTMTSYNSEPGQTDDSPCITANNFNVCEHGIEDTVAANFLKFGTKVRIPDLFGDRIFIVRDRMNKRYPDRLDVWMINKSDSLKFGVKRARIEIVVENSNL